MGNSPSVVLGTWCPMSLLVKMNLLTEQLVSRATATKFPYEEGFSFRRTCFERNISNRLLITCCWYLLSKNTVGLWLHKVSDSRYHYHLASRLLTTKNQARRIRAYKYFVGNCMGDLV